MIIDTETKRKLREMNATDLLDAFERLDEQVGGCGRFLGDSHAAIPWL